MLEIKVIGNEILCDGVSVATLNEGLSRTFRESFIEQVEHEIPDLEELEEQAYDRGYDGGYDKGRVDTEWEHEDDYENGYQDGKHDAQKEDENYWSGR